MATTIGHVTVELLARTPGNEPIVIGSVELPIKYTATRPRATRARIETPTTVKTTKNIVHLATHDLGEGIH